MNALVFDGKVALVDDYPQPKLAANEALVRVLYAGICNTDLEIMRGYADFRGVLGHEFVGIVERSPDRSLEGQRVVGEINAYCGRCEACQDGRQTHCYQRTVLDIRGRDGAFAEYLSLPLNVSHRVPESIPDEAAVFTEPLAAALEITNQVHIRPTDGVVVLGAGKLGLLVAQVLGLIGCDLLVIDHHAENLSFLQRRGISTVPESPLGFQADVVVECTGNPSGFQAGQALLKARGTLVLKSTYHGFSQVDLSKVVVDEITLVGSRCGPFPAALRLLGSGFVDVGSLIDAVYPLAEGRAALARAGEKGVRKVLLKPNDGTTGSTSGTQWKNQDLNNRSISPRYSMLSCEPCRMLTGL